MAKLSLDVLRDLPPRAAAFQLIREIKERADPGGLAEFYPEEGNLRRALYPKHVAALNAGSEAVERWVLGGNRVGKSRSIGGFEVACHLTGNYPSWWEGRRIDHPMLVWACGTTAEKVRDSVQAYLLGRLKTKGTLTVATGGLIPARALGKLSRKAGTTDAIDQATVVHKKGFESVLKFKAYKEGRPSFESEAVDFIWCDEEPPAPIYTECKMRLLTTKGSIMTTLTPVEGMTETVMRALEGMDLL